MVTGWSLRQIVQYVWCQSSGWKTFAAVLWKFYADKSYKGSRIRYIQSTNPAYSYGKNGLYLLYIRVYANAKQIQWEFSIGLGDHPIAIDNPVYFYSVIAIILVLGCCLCVIREKQDESSGKRWGYPPNFQFAVIGYDTETDRVITLVFDEAIYKNKHVDASDFEVIILKKNLVLSISIRRKVL